MPPEGERQALLRPCGPGVWERLLEEFTAELHAAAPAREATPTPLDLAGQPWCPREGGRRPLPPRLAELAATGAWQAAHLQPPDGPAYASRSEARFAVLSAAAAAGWHLADLEEEMHHGAWTGLARLLAHKTRWHLDHDWAKAAGDTWTALTTSRTATAGTTGEQVREPGRKIHTRERYPTRAAPRQDHPGHGASSFPSPHSPAPHSPGPRVLTEYQAIRGWQNAVRCAERDPAWRAR